MKLGRCVKPTHYLTADSGSNPSVLGCSADVLQMADWKCSGKRECSVRIPDADFHSTRPCFEGLEMYLDATYACIKGKQTVYGNSAQSLRQGINSLVNELV